MTDTRLNFIEDVPSHSYCHDHIKVKVTNFGNFIRKIFLDLSLFQAK